MTAHKRGERKLQILQGLAQMLEDPRCEKITTAALAKQMEVSEAALYRHFASKAQMYEGLIDFIESSVFGLINQITESQEKGLLQVQAIVMMLLNFGERNPGMTRLLIGDVLIHEDERLQLRMNQFYDKVELSIRQGLRLAVTQGAVPEVQVQSRTVIVLNYIIGHWHRFVRSGFQKKLPESPQTIVTLLLV